MGSAGGVGGGWDCSAFQADLQSVDPCPGTVRCAHCTRLPRLSPHGLSLWASELYQLGILSPGGLRFGVDGDAGGLRSSRPEEGLAGSAGELYGQRLASPTEAFLELAELFFAAAPLGAGEAGLGGLFRNGIGF